MASRDIPTIKEFAGELSIKDGSNFTIATSTSGSWSATDSLGNVTGTFWLQGKAVNIVTGDESSNSYIVNTLPSVSYDSRVGNVTATYYTAINQSTHGFAIADFFDLYETSAVNEIVDYVKNKLSLAPYLTQIGKKLREIFPLERLGLGLLPEEDGTSKLLITIHSKRGIKESLSLLKRFDSTYFLDCSVDIKDSVVVLPEIENV